MSTLTMFDSAANAAFPPDAAAYGAYVDGHIGDQPNYPYIVSEFPAAQHVAIVLDPALVLSGYAHPALDVENGAASPAGVPAWIAAQHARGVPRPIVYISVEPARDALLPLLAKYGISQANARLWTAHYGAGEHICGPHSCGLVPVDADGTQWDDRALGRVLDQSLLRDDFFGTFAPTPQQWTEFDMGKLRVLRLGDADAPGTFWAVRRLQSLLFCAGQILGLPDAVVACDGQFGPKTAAAVRAVQQHYGIAVDGICGSATWSVLLTGAA